MRHHFRPRKRVSLILTTTAVTLVVVSGTALADHFDWWAAQPHGFEARNDLAFVGGDGLAHGNVLDNDHDGTAVLRASALDDPAAGSLVVNPDGTFTFTPASAGSHGTVRFSYTATDAVTLFQTNLPPLDTFDGVTISGGSFGSSFAPATSGKPGLFYGITDRGPNADSGDGNKVEPETGLVPAHPTFHPMIGLFQLVDGTAKLIGEPIVLKDINGNPYNGLPNTVTKKGIAASSEIIEDMNGTVLATDPDGYDPEGLVVLKDGTFWVSDEYGPYITHFDTTGKEIERLSPWVSGVPLATDSAFHNIDTAHPLPVELQNRTKNKGMEGLTVTPDGKTLVGIMQSALTQPDLAGAKTALITATRIVTIDLKTKAMHEYLYLLDDPANHAGNANSEITAISNTKFLVDERDGNVGAGAFKQLYLIDLSGATDVLGSGDPKGFLINGKSIDAFVGQANTAAALKLLKDAGVTPVGKAPYLDMGSVVTQADPSGFFFGHDKIEGVATTDGGQTVYLSNDSDFGIDRTNEAVGPYTLHQKTLPNGKADDGEVLAVDVSKLPLVLGVATVTIKY
jgi:hypothetical protein